MNTDYNIYAVSLSKNTVATGERFTIRIDVISWDWLKKNVTSWDQLKTRFTKWSDLLG